MNVLEIRDQAGWQRLEPLWNPLLESSASATTFLTWEWLTAWWSAYGNADDLHILAALDDTGAVRGIAPLRRQRVRRYGRTFATLAFIGDGSSDSDYLDFIAARGSEDPVLRAFFDHLQERLGRGTILQLNEIPAASPNLPVLRSLAGSNGLCTEDTVPCATIRLPDRWDDYLGMLRPRFRTKVRSVLRNLEGRPEVRFGFCDKESDLERLLPILFDLHTRRWNSDGQPGVFGWDRKRQFYRALSPLLLGRGALRFSWLEWNGRILACQYGFLHGATYLHLQEGYEPASEHWNIGMGLRAWTIREFQRAGVREYDFLAGVARHKMDWGAERKESRRVVIASRSVANLLFCRGPEWEERTKEAVKKFLPEAVLAARRARLQRRGAPRAGQAGTKMHLRTAAARGYVHLGLPAAARLARSRYQASVSRTGRRVSWTRRGRPAGRILFYHRVNDARDPFFPSTPVDVFERQMRFLARHYKVVSLARLIEHLDTGPAETVLALTFDDGYEDNYTNVLPILRRYQLPATVFLSTGGIDSRAPLWFEVLAGAVKHTSLECLDIESDVPRRLWLRTREERLRANDALFAWLRGVPDAVRQSRLSAILRDLAAPETDRLSGLMLTWDQVRCMKQHGIDFGGHTVTHPFVSRLGREQADWEISECKRRIEAELQAPVAHFAYPSGREGDFEPWNKDVIRAAGYQAAVTTLWGLNYGTTDRMELRRGGPWEEDPALFAWKMDWYHLVDA
jgi:CelD/BcsL family acetyltransferase involved in cellulose biosynthesis/peptidoglycan/xylan/chitin deacetylase (PgdA/CDA1 family)